MGLMADLDQECARRQFTEVECQTFKRLIDQLDMSGWPPDLRTAIRERGDQGEALVDVVIWWIRKGGRFDKSRRVPTKGALLFLYFLDLINVEIWKGGEARTLRVGFSAMGYLLVEARDARLPSLAECGPVLLGTK